MNVSTMAANLIGSEIIKIGGEINELIRGGQKICNLTIGDFDPKIFPIPELLSDYITDAYKAGNTNYPPANGVLELRQAISKFTKDQLGLDYSANDILVAGGSRPLIYATYLSIVDAGDKVVFPVPSWNNNHYCHLSGATQAMVDALPENNFMPSPADIEPHLKDAVLLALCSPLNPTGTMFTKADLEAICDMVIAENKMRSPSDKPLYILYDQIYWMLNFGGNQHFDPVNLRPELREYVIYIDGTSKSFAATGVRVGYAFGPAHIMDKMKSILGHVGAWAPKAEQVAMANFLNNTDAVNTFLTGFKAKVHHSLDTLYKAFKALKAEGFEVDAIEPMGAIYLTVKVDMIGKRTPEGDILVNSKDVNSYLIHKAGLAMVPFSAFGCDEHTPWFRISVGGCDITDITDAMPRYKKALEALV